MPHVATGAGAVDAAVAEGRRRLLAQHGLRAAFLAAAIALAGPNLLLAFGADSFPTGLLWLLAAAGVAWAFYVWKKSEPTAYHVAQILDARLNAEDQISTAYYFSHLESGEFSASAAARQRELADAVARSGDLTAALPYVWPRSAAIAGGLFVLMLALFGLRVALQPQLSLDPPLMSLLFPSLMQQSPEQAPYAEEAKLQRPKAEEPTSLTEAGELERDERPPTPPPPQDALTAPIGEDAPVEDQPFEMPEVEGLSVGDELTPESGENSASQGEGDQPGDETAQDEPAGDWGEESNDLLERLKDAFKDMMESMNMDPPQSASGESQTGEGEQGSEPSEEAGEGAQAEAEGGQAGDAEMEGGEGEEGSSEQAAQGQGGADSEQASDQGQAASASGSGDGSKEFLEDQAAQEAAMDALEEFYMQRAEELQGEIMVETVDAEQTAQTPYQSVQGRHADRGGAVSRDEIPLAYQRYIQNYFRNLRANDQK